jgi:hypothetical protein
MYGQPSPGSRPPGSIDFEITDLSDARQAMEELPAGLREREQLEPGYWDQRRRKPTPADRALTGAALDWLIKLPPEVRPKALCEQFPRVANVIAEAWGDGTAGDRLFERLLTDDRGGRRGFPSEIEHELRRLVDHRAGLRR